MRTIIRTFLVVVALTQVGCAVGGRVGGTQRGVAVVPAVIPEPPLYVAPFQP